MEIDDSILCEVLSNLPAAGETQFPGSTYESGIEEVLLWLLGEISDEDFEYSV